MIAKRISGTVSHWHRSLFARLRVYLFAGILVTAPISLTIYLTYIFLRFVDDHVGVFFPESWHLHFAVPGIGLLIALGFFILVGWLTRNVLGTLLVSISDTVFTRLPVIRIMYGALKQIFGTLITDQSSSLREVVLFEYPGPGLWAIGFATGLLQGDAQALAGGELVNVFRPATPNAASGFVSLVPREKLIVLDMSAEDAFKLIVSGGLVTPPRPVRFRARV